MAKVLSSAGLGNRSACFGPRVDGLRGGGVGIVTAVVLLLGLTSPTHGYETITFRPRPDSDAVIRVSGDVLVTAADGGMLLMAEDGQMWTVQPERLIERETNPGAMSPIDADEAAKRMLAELPPGFRVYKTAHYVICHNTPDFYVEWVGSLFEQAYAGFYSFWKNKGRQLEENRFPLTAIVFADQASFAQFARPELGDMVDSVIGYYNLQSNRMLTYYLQNAERRVATIVHEAVHQLSYNSGLQRRMADNPYWVSEGLATYFETPDGSARGWRTIGGVNQVNLGRFHNYLPNRPADSLVTLLRDDARFRNPAEANAAYAEAWALNYFLLRTKRKEYIAYLKMLSEGELLRPVDARARVQMFQDAMKMEIDEFDQEFIKYVLRYVRR